MNTKAVRVLNKLYISACVVGVFLIIYLGINATYSEYKKDSIFKKAHTYSETDHGYNPSQEGMSLEESRLLIADESARRLLRNEKISVEEMASLEKKNPKLRVDTGCFDLEGNLDNHQPVRSNECNHISIFQPGRPFATASIYLGIILGYFLASYFFRRWAVWLVR